MRDSLKLIIFSIVLFALALLASQIVELPLYMLIILSVFFTGFSYVFHLRLQKALTDANKNKFTHVFLGLTGLKMLASLILLACILALTKHDKLNSGVCIMTYYMMYTAFEVAVWRKKLQG